MKKSHPPPPHLGNGHFLTGGLWNLNWLLFNEFLSLHKCIPQPNNTGFGILDQGFAPAQGLIYSPNSVGLVIVFFTFKYSLYRFDLFKTKTYIKIEGIVEICMM